MLDSGCSMLDAGYSMLDARCWILDARCSMLDTRCSILDARCWILDIRCWMKDAAHGARLTAPAVVTLKRDFRLHQDFAATRWLGKQGSGIKKDMILGLAASLIEKETLSRGVY